MCCIMSANRLQQWPQGGMGKSASRLDLRFDLWCLQQYEMMKESVALLPAARAHIYLLVCGFRCTSTRHERRKWYFCRCVAICANTSTRFKRLQQHEVMKESVHLKDINIVYFLLFLFEVKKVFKIGTPRLVNKEASFVSVPITRSIAESTEVTPP